MTLFVVATPIGNLEDVTLRALRVLREADLIAAENIAQTKKLLAKYEISTPLTRWHQHSQPTELRRLVHQLQQGKNIAYVSDAGTPGVADPGGRLVDEARRAGIAVVPIPGASAVTALLSVAGMPTDAFTFIGFLPKKKGRRSLLAELANLDVPIVIFESPNRVGKTLRELFQTLGDRRVVVGRELTKLHEEILDITLRDAAERLTNQSARGEFVMIIAPTL